MFNAAKDALASEAARHYLNHLIARYGKLKELEIDSKNERMSLVCLLEGENLPLAVEIEKYKIEEAETAGKKTLKIVTCTASQPWLQNLLMDFVCGRPFEIPEWVATAL